jgi:hypothetical protein
LKKLAAHLFRSLKPKEEGGFESLSFFLASSKKATFIAKKFSRAFEIKIRTYMRSKKGIKRIPFFRALVFQSTHALIFSDQLCNAGFAIQTFLCMVLETTTQAR